MSRAMIAGLISALSVGLVSSGEGSASSCLYSVFPEHGVPGHNLEKVPAKADSAAACMKLCDGKDDCKSVDYERETKDCFMQSKGRREAGQDGVELKSGEDYKKYDHFTCEGRRCAWVAVPNASIPGHNIDRHEDVSVAECLELCAKNDSCLSADYDNRVRSCDLQDVSQHTAALNQGNENPYDHYTCLNPN